MFRKAFILSPLVILVSLSSCMQMIDESKYAKFDYDPFNYWKAKPVHENPKIPQAIAQNLKVRPLYPIPYDKKLNGELKMSKVPPTINRKIEEYS